MPAHEATPNHRSSGFAPWLALAAILILTVIALRIEGQRWWCACSETFLWTTDVWSMHCSRHLADAYTFAHFEHGLIFFTAFALLAPKWSMAWRLCASIALAAGWEVLENSEFIISRYRDNTMSVEYLGDSVINSLADIAACILGFFYTRRFGIIAAMVTLAIIEVGLMIVIRDNLIVGTLMLIVPIEAIREWQIAAGPQAAPT